MALLRFSEVETCRMHRPLSPTIRSLVKHKVSNVHVYGPVEGIAMHTRVKHIVVKIIHCLTEQLLLLGIRSTIAQ